MQLCAYWTKIGCGDARGYVTNQNNNLPVYLAEKKVDRSVIYRFGVTYKKGVPYITWVTRADDFSENPMQMHQYSDGSGRRFVNNTRRTHRKYDHVSIPVGRYGDSKQCYVGQACPIEVWPVIQQFTKNCIVNL